ncbi:SDR family NAD(P)-dependent oxidoreductase [Shimia ponticola]|uniref:SDR family NAD(P)-dependent oxidoreductase n=1 Tax=Shimia ponticola TaxID=2582893 RepID=UPI0011BF5870|nr:SDR family oxidoreductase [Shimia ponticola]
MKDLTGKTIIITGASRGIGAATVRHLAALGANVVAAARSKAALNYVVSEVTETGGKAIAQACDVADEAAVRALIERATDEFGGLDVLVNNAGLIDPIARIEDSDPEAWSQIVDVNLKGVYYGMRHAIPAMAGDGTIINISSGAATGALEGWSHYCATKAAVLSLTKCGHKEHGDRGITVVGLSPGTVATDMQVQIKDSGINPVSQLDPGVHIPAEYVAKAIAYLCTPAAAQYAGTDFSIKTDEGRAAVGLPPVV